MAPEACRDRVCSVCQSVVLDAAWTCKKCGRGLHEKCAEQWHQWSKTCPTCRHGEGRLTIDVSADVIDLTADVIDLTEDVIDLTEDVIDLTDDEDVIDLTEDEYASDLTEDECGIDDIDLTLNDFDMEIGA